VDTGELVAKLLNTRRHGRPFVPGISLLRPEVEWDKFYAAEYNNVRPEGVFSHGARTVPDYIELVRNCAPKFVTNAGQAQTHCSSELGLVALVTTEHDGTRLAISVEPKVFLPVVLREYELVVTLSPGRRVVRWRIHPLRRESFEANIELVLGGYWEFTLALELV